MLGDLRCPSGVSLQRDQILGFFDLFKSNKDGGARKSNAADKFSERANDKRAQTYDRVEALSALSELGTKEAVAALLNRGPDLHESPWLWAAAVLAAGPGLGLAIHRFAARSTPTQPRGPLRR